MEPWKREFGYNVCKNAKSRLGIPMPDSFKKMMSERMSGKGNPMYGRRGKDSPGYGRKQSEDEIRRRVEKNSGERCTYSKLNWQKF